MVQAAPYSRAGTARCRGPVGRLSGAPRTGDAAPVPPDRHDRSAHRLAPPPRATHHRVRAHGAPPWHQLAAAGLRGDGGRRTPPACAPRIASRPIVADRPASAHTWRRSGPTRPNTGTRPARPSLQARSPGAIRPRNGCANRYSASVSLRTGNCPASVSRTMALTFSEKSFRSTQFEKAAVVGRQVREGCPCLRPERDRGDAVAPDQLPVRIDQFGSLGCSQS